MSSVITMPAEARLLRSVEKAHTDTGGIDDLAETSGIDGRPGSDG